MAVWGGGDIQRRSRQSWAAWILGPEGQRMKLVEGIRMENMKREETERKELASDGQHLEQSEQRGTGRGRDRGHTWCNRLSSTICRLSSFVSTMEEAEELATALVTVSGPASGLPRPVLGAVKAERD
ncbi:hypothetical protein COCNU_03G002480 [Cocos nucifera]|uniref:Uncharacterized protein n=1 Tax=Cocos nucifera TaxID=13894 RepID=A0A8K0I256_COCNU|nr:hypothetical protein COCNU_03G002480 [Cocos nucifera]